MKPNASVLTVTGAVALAAIAGVTYAVLKPAPSEIATPQSPDPAITSASRPVASPSPAASAPPVAKSLTTRPSSNSPSSNSQSSSGQSTDSDVAQSPVPAASTASRAVESCTTGMALVNDPNPPLNVRSAPNTDAASTVVGQLRNGTLVTVVDEQNGWFQIETPQKGWISKQNTESGCNQKVERLGFDSGSSISIADRFIGTGSHKYVLNASKGQQLTLSRSKGPFPVITAPDGKPLVGTGLSDEKRSSWSGALPQTGEYSVQLESNFKGYKYAFQLEVK